jgi:hypothetical protein
LIQIRLDVGVVRTIQIQQNDLCRGLGFVPHRLALAQFPATKNSPEKCRSHAFVATQQVERLSVDLLALTKRSTKLP